MVEDKVTEHKCPNCGKAMVEKRGRYGPFLGCSDYPNCKTILNLDKEGNVKPPKPPAEPTGISCHKCKKGEFVIRKGRKGEFLGCNRFPKCRTIVSMEKKEKLQELQAQGKWPPDDIERANEILGKKKKSAGKSKKKSKKKKKSS
jgi:DNA topoisomerase-1